MGKCVFCHGGPGAHGDDCPMRIETDWTPVDTGPMRQVGRERRPLDLALWVDLTRSLIHAWRSDTCVYDRGTPQDEAKLEALWDGMDKALTEGSAERAMALLFEYYNPMSDGPTPGRGKHGAPSR